MRLWHFVVIEDGDVLRRLEALARTGPYIAQAPPGGRGRGAQDPPLAVLPFGYPVGVVGRGQKQRKALAAVAHRGRYDQPFA